MNTRIFKLKTAVTLSSIILGFSVDGQTIVNPDFETYSACPSGQTQLVRATGWTRPTAGTPDYFNDCGYNISTTISANSGDGFSGGYMELKYPPSGLSNYKEYITNHLSSPLIAGETYTFSFQIAHLYGASPSVMLPASVTYTDLPADEQGYIGAVFSASTPSTSNTQSGSASFGATSIVDTFGIGRVLVPATDTNVYGSASRNAWVEVVLEYTAAGGEEYMTVGQFRHGATSLSDSTAAYYLFDNFASPIVLPVKFQNFVASNNSNEAMLKWTTVSEANNKGFEIERSEVGNSWMSLGFVIAATADGNSTSVQNYSFTDSKPVNGVNYYRLKQIDVDGKFNYSSIRSVVVAQQAAIAIQPNPAKDYITVKGLTGTETIKIYSMHGRLVKEIVATGSTTTIALDELAAGVYHVNVVSASGVVFVSKVIKL